MKNCIGFYRPFTMRPLPKKSRWNAGYLRFLKQVVMRHWVVTVEEVRMVDSRCGLPKPRLPMNFQIVTMLTQRQPAALPSALRSNIIAIADIQKKYLSAGKLQRVVILPVLWRSMEHRSMVVH